MLFEKAKEYADKVISGEEITNKDVRSQCLIFINNLEDQHDDEFLYYFDHNELKKVEGILSLLNFATGLGVIGKPVLEGLVGFQAFFLCNIFGWRFKANPEKFVIVMLPCSFA